MSLEPGDVVDRYVVDELLGQGGIAMVYLVRHRQLESQHALKILTVSSSAIRARLLQEGRVQARLHHHNVVAVTDVIEVEGAPGLIMEYIKGPSMEAYLKENRPSFPEAEKLALGIIAGVAEAHKRGLIHRDLKPANVLLAPTGDFFTPKVADFGLVKHVADGGSGLSATRTGLTMGTPRYMAPEQIRDAKSVDSRADIFSLGAVLYELVTGQMAFPSNDVIELFNAIATGDYIPPRQHDPFIPQAVERAILGALEVDREKRISSCEQLLQVWNGEDLPRSGRRISHTAPTHLGDKPALGHRPSTSPMPLPLPLGPSPAPKAAQVGVARPQDPATSPPATHSPTQEETPGEDEDGAFGTETQVRVRPQAPRLPPRPAQTPPPPPPRPPDTGTIQPVEDELPPPSSGRTPWGLIILGLGGAVALGLALIGLAWLFVVPDKEEVPEEPILSPVVDRPASRKPGEVESVTAPAPPPAGAPAPAAPTEPPHSVERSSPPATAPAPAPAPEVAPEPARPRPPAPRTGMVSLKGDATSVWMQGDAGRSHAGAVSPGTYTIHASFGDAAPAVFGRITVEADKSYTIECSSMLQTCRVR